MGIGELLTLECFPIIVIEAFYFFYFFPAGTLQMNSRNALLLMSDKTRHRSPQRSGIATSK
jgi:hypothetical protein